jgi:hypothetical protein
MRPPTMRYPDRHSVESVVSQSLVGLDLAGDGGAAIRSAHATLAAAAMNNTMRRTRAKAALFECMGYSVNGERSMYRRAA